MEKPILPVDIFNDDHLQELIENYEVYGPFIKDIIQKLGSIVVADPDYGCTYTSATVYPDFIGELHLEPIQES